MPGYNKDDGKKVWVQYKDDPVKERVLYDSQVIYISYSSTFNCIKSSVMLRD
jgi:hypothetical protein